MVGKEGVSFLKKENFRRGKFHVSLREKVTLKIFHASLWEKEKLRCERKL